MKAAGFSRISKELITSEIEKEIGRRPAFFIAQHSRVAATALDRLRARLRQAGSRYFVVKNSLAKRALEKSKLDKLCPGLVGSCGIAFSSGDPAASSKILVEFAKENESFRIQQAYLNGEVMTADQVKVLASLPSREVLIAKVVGGIATPLSRFVGVLSGTMRKFVLVLDAIAKKKNE